MVVKDNNVKLFTEKAELVSAVVSEVSSMEEAYRYTLDLCDKKDACKVLVSGCEEKLSDKTEDLCKTKTGKTISAPVLSKKQFKTFDALCDKNGFVLIKDSVRNHLGGIDIGFTVAEHGIAETGSLVLCSRSEELRLSTMVSEVHVAVISKAKIVADSYELETYLEKKMKSADYTAFITGASRTADIERVLAIGVHGPLELHILLLGDA